MLFLYIGNMICDNEKLYKDISIGNSSPRVFVNDLNALNWYKDLE